MRPSELDWTGRRRPAIWSDLAARSTRIMMSITSLGVRLCRPRSRL